MREGAVLAVHALACYASTPCTGCAVGILSIHCARVRGAKRIGLINNQQFRLDFAQPKVEGLVFINFDEKKVVPTTLQLPHIKTVDLAVQWASWQFNMQGHMVQIELT